jgi:hypothetical protein
MPGTASPPVSLAWLLLAAVLGAVSASLPGIALLVMAFYLNSLPGESGTAIGLLGLGGVVMVAVGVVGGCLNGCLVGAFGRTVGHAMAQTRGSRVGVIAGGILGGIAVAVLMLAFLLAPG